MALLMSVPGAQYIVLCIDIPLADRHRAFSAGWGGRLCVAAGPIRHLLPMQLQCAHSLCASFTHLATLTRRCTDVDVVQAYTARQAEHSANALSRELNVAEQTREREHEQMLEQISRINRCVRSALHPWLSLEVLIMHWRNNKCICVFVFADGWTNAADRSS